LTSINDVYIVYNPFAIFYLFVWSRHYHIFILLHLPYTSHIQLEVAHPIYASKVIWYTKYS
jgi:hypothetical protein